MLVSKLQENGLIDEYSSNGKLGVELGIELGTHEVAK